MEHGLQHEPHDSRFPPAPPAERMSQDEAMAVMELYQAQLREQEAAASMPSTADLAEALRIPESRVRAMLEQVRLRRSLDAYRTPPVAKRPAHGLSLAFGIGLVAVFVILATLLFVSFRSEVVAPAEAPRAAPTVELAAPRDAVAPTPTRDEGTAADEGTVRAGTPVPPDVR